MKLAKVDCNRKPNWMFMINWKAEDLQTVNSVRWARTHPGYFFENGRVCGTAMLEQLTEAARTLRSTEVEVICRDGWCLVASGFDWFAQARFPVPDDFNFQSITAFPELGRNRTRAEFIVAVFAADIIVRGPSGTHVVKGAVDPFDPVLALITNTQAWVRVVAFRGLGDSR